MTRAFHTFLALAILLPCLAGSDFPEAAAEAVKQSGAGPPLPAAGRLARRVGWAGNDVGTTNATDGAWCRPAGLEKGGALRLLADSRSEKEGAPEGSPEGESLFDGRSLDGWHRRNRPGHGWGAVWKVADGAITGVQEWPGATGVLVTRKAVGDADLRLQVRTDWPLDAGVHLRMGRFAGGWEVTLHTRDDGDVAGVACGGLFDRVHTPAKGWKDVWKKDDWNDLRVTIRGNPPVIKTYLNGKAMTTFKAEGADLDEPPPARGPIALKVSGPETCFNHRLYVRRVRVRRLK